MIKYLLLLLPSLCFASDYWCTGVDDTQLLQDAINSGDEIRIVNTCRITSPLQVTSDKRPTIIRGIHPRLSIIELADSGMDGIVVTGLDSLVMEDIGMTSLSQQTMGEMIRIDPPVGVNFQSQFINVELWNPYVGIHFVSAAHWKFDRGFIGRYTGIGIEVENRNVPDSGDGSISNSLFHGQDTSGTGIIQRSGGGLRVENNKILAGLHGYRLVLSPNITTCDLLMVGNSIEGMNTTAIYLNLPTSSTYDKIIINGNETNNSNNGIIVTGAFSSMAISGNVIRKLAGSGAGIKMMGPSIFSIDGNTIRGSGGIGINITSASSNGIVSNNVTSGVTAVVNKSSTVTVK